MINTEISHYKISEKLGGGGMGVVYKAEDTRLHRTVALKLLPPELTRDEEAKKRFILEAETASSLDHNNICVIHEIDEVDGQLFICMNHYEGETLKSKISQGPLSAEESADIALQIAEGLKTAHEKGIVHRDIKPANIFLTTNGTVKILDFGLAKLTGYSALTRMGETLGTTAYMSPEQARGDNVDHRTDIWSLGILLYEMVSGRIPFRGEYDNAIIYNILNSEPEPPAGVPDKLKEIILKSLNKNPDNRYRDMQEMISDLENFSGGKQDKQESVIKILKSAGLILFGIVILAGLYFFLQSTGIFSEQTIEKSIAVLPLTTITREEADEIFAEGIQEDILTHLAKIKDLKVIARTSVRQYKNTELPISEIANQLKVNYIIEGSVRKSENKLRIAIQLIDARTQTHIWAEDYDRQYDDIFAIQTDIANKVASNLNTILTSEERNLIAHIPTENMEAYDYYLKGQYYWDNSNDIEGNRLAAEMFEKAVELDSGFALAYAKLSVVYSTLYTPSVFDQGEIFLAKAKDALSKAEKINTGLPEVYYARANYYLFTSGYEIAVAECKKALDRTPNNSEYIFWLGNLLLSRSRVDEALRYFMKSFDLNPNGYQEGHYIAYVHILKRNWQEAEKWIDEYIPKHPGNSIGYVRKAEISMLGYGNLQKAREVINEGVYNGKWLSQLIPMLWIIEIYSRNYNEALKKNDLDTSFAYYNTRKMITLKLMDRQDELQEMTSAANKRLTERLKNNNNNSRLHNSMALVYAMMGLKNEAVTEINKSVELSGEELDNYFLMQAPLETMYRLAYIYIINGEYEKALDEIEKLLKRPYRFTKWNLKYDPIYDPLRNLPRFKALIKE